MKTHTNSVSSDTANPFSLKVVIFVLSAKYSFPFSQSNIFSIVYLILIMQKPFSVFLSFFTLKDPCDSTI